MPHTEASIGTTNYVVAITAGHHELTADEDITGAKDVGPSPNELLCSVGRLHSDHSANVCRAKQWSLRSVPVSVHYKGSDNAKEINRVLKFDGELDEQQHARLADIAEPTPVTLTLKQGLPIIMTLK